MNNSHGRLARASNEPSHPHQTSDITLQAGTLGSVLYSRFISYKSYFYLLNIYRVWIGYYCNNGSCGVTMALTVAHENALEVFREFPFDYFAVVLGDFLVHRSIVARQVRVCLASSHKVDSAFQAFRGVD